MNGKRLVICLAVILLAALVVLAVVEINRREANIQGTGNTTTPTQEQTTNTTGNTTTSTAPDDTEPSGGDPAPEYSVRVDTAYGALYYQDQWIELMDVEQTQEADVLTVLFLANINGQRYQLFTLTVGGESGALAGKLTDASGTARDVFVVLHSVEAQDGFSGLTDGEKNRLFAMQEDLNFVIANLK